MNVPVTTQKELKWKMKDGTLVSIKSLSNNELKLFRKIAASKITTHYKTFEFFTELQEQMDNEVHTRLEQAKSLALELQQIEDEN